MKVVLPATGSRGDVQPFITLACVLNTAGHEALEAVPVGSVRWLRELMGPSLAWTTVCWS